MQSHDDLPDPGALIASTLSLMTGFVRTGCPRQATLVSRQLAYLQCYPDSRMPPILKSVARKLRAEWEQVLFTLPHSGGADGLVEAAKLH
jgi:hypothetical protein